MFILARALVYSALFIGFLLVFLPSRVVARAGLTTPGHMGVLQMVGGALTTLGAALAISCILTFVFVGRGTPAPFDPPRRLVVRGPYRFLRNPMYAGATLALFGAAIYLRSLALAAYAAAFLVGMHVFVRAFEEPTLRKSFGVEYDEYCRRVGRWWPRRSRS